MSIPSNFRDELVNHVDLVEVIGRHVKLKKTGANFVGLCPFHQEKSPSFSVNPLKQFYHCFGCGKSGDAVSFLMDYMGLGYVDAVQGLARDCGMQVPEITSMTPEQLTAQKAWKSRQEMLATVLEEAATAYQQFLKVSQEAVSYFKSRGVTGKIASRFGLGYAPDDWNALAKVFDDYGDAKLVEVGLVIDHKEGAANKRYDRFRHRVMFPIRNINAAYIGFGGRVLNDNKPKYLNSPETVLFSKGKELYGLFEAKDAIRKQGFVLVTEGYMDVIALSQLGLENTVATLGTACTAEHVQKLFRLTDSIVFSFDGDSAGRKAAQKALEISLSYANDVRSVKFLFLPTEHDPDSFIRAFGQDAFLEEVRNAVTLSDFLIVSAQSELNLQTAEERAKFAMNIKPLWGALPDGALKIQLHGKIAQLVQISTEELQQVWSGEPPKAILQKKNTRLTNHIMPTDNLHRSAYLAQLRTGKKLATRMDLLLRLLLLNSALWFDLSGEEQNLLCEAPPPYAGIFHWLENVLHQQGAVAWNMLHDDLLHRSEFGSLVDELMPNDIDLIAIGEDAKVELRDLINRLMIEKIKKEETAALLESDRCPSMLTHYKNLQQRRKELEKLL